MTTEDLKRAIQTTIIEEQRAAFELGVRFCVRQLEAAASLVEADQKGDVTVKTPDGEERSHPAIKQSGNPAFAERLRDIASLLRTEAPIQATQYFPEWKD